MSLSFCLLTALCLIIGIIFEQQSLLVSAFEFDHDVDPELCMTKWKEDENACLSNMWFICPLLCARVLNLGRGTMAQEKENPDKFYELHAKRLVVTENFDVDKGVDISLEDNEVRLEFIVRNVSSGKLRTWAGLPDLCYLTTICLHCHSIHFVLSLLPTY